MSNTASNVDLMVGNRPLSSLRVVDLKQELEKRGLSKSGSKKDLVDRLRLHLQIEKHRDTGASADEEELPNYSQVHDELADQNPFIRDYLASQAELFHSQKVVKKLVEEEAKRESETSADESVDSPMKQPPSLDREESPVSETRRQSRRRADSQREDMTAEKLTTRSSRSRSPAAATAPNSSTEAKSNDVPVQNEQPNELNIEATMPAKVPEEKSEEKVSLASEEKVSLASEEKVSLASEEKVSLASEEKVSLASEEKASLVSEEKVSLTPKGKVSLASEEKVSLVSEEKVSLKSKEKVSLAPEEKVSLTSKEKVSLAPEEKVSLTSKEKVSLTSEEKVSLPSEDTKLVKELIDEPESTNSNLLPDKTDENVAPEAENSHKQEEVTSMESNAQMDETKIVTSDANSSEDASKTKIMSPPVVENKSEEMTSTKDIEAKPEELQEEQVAKESVTTVDPDCKDENEKVTPTSVPVEKSPIPEPKDKANSPAPSSDHPREETPKEKPDESESSEDDENSSRSKGRSRSSRSRSRSKSRSRSRSNESKDDNQSKGDGDKRNEPDGNDDESQKVEPLAVEVSGKRGSRRKSVSRSPVRGKSTEKEIPDGPAEEPVPKDEPEVNPETKSTEAEEKMDVDETSSPRYKSSQKETSYSNNDIAAEEALDYGEEEEDEERNESDPQEFSWARRALRFKNKTAFVAPTCKWKLEEDGKHLVVKSELLNTYYEDIKLVPLEQLKLEEKVSETVTETKKDIERKKSISKEVEPEEPLPTRTVENIAPIIKRTVSIISTTKVTVNEPEETDKALTPPRNPPSDVLLITNLVRPFTLHQLKEMLQRTGNLQDIWVDKIKSKCIAKFGSQEEAFETRAALHGVCWPNSNPKSLHVDYTTQDNLDEHKAKEGAEQSTTTEKPASAQPVPVREWDVGKKAEPKSPGRIRKRSRSRSTSRDRTKRSRRSSSPGRRRRSKSPAHERRNRGGEGKEPEPMGKALDELFRKTIATPSIYWLPLTPEQIAEKEELRRKRMLERERRLAELSKMRPR